MYTEVHMGNSNSKIHKVKPTEVANITKEIKRQNIKKRLLIIICVLAAQENIADAINKSKIQKQLSTYFNINETKITHQKEIAVQFNNFFINSRQQLANKL